MTLDALHAYVNRSHSWQRLFYLCFNSLFRTGSKSEQAEKRTMFVSMMLLLVNLKNSNLCDLYDQSSLPSFINLTFDFYKEMLRDLRCFTIETSS